MRWVVAVLVTLLVWAALSVLGVLVLGAVGSLGPVELGLIALVALGASVALNRKRLRAAWR